MTGKHPSPRRKPSYDVGFGKPPKHRQFKKGQSGNPNGRPKGSKNKPTNPFEDTEFQRIFMEEASRPITIQEGGQPVSHSAIRLVIKRILLNAVNGKYYQQRFAIETYRAIQERQRQEQLRGIETLYRLKLEMQRTLDDCRARGRPLPPRFIHPDAIVVEHDGCFEIYAPVTEDQWDFLEYQTARYWFLKQTLEEAHASLRLEEKPARRRRTEERMTRLQTTRDRLTTEMVHFEEAWPYNWPPRRRPKTIEVPEMPPSMRRVIAQSKEGPDSEDDE